MIKIHCCIATFVRIWWLNKDDNNSNNDNGNNDVNDNRNGNQH